jgi:hypothetical protein
MLSEKCCLLYLRFDGKKSGYQNTNSRNFTQNKPNGKILNSL